MTSSKCTNPDAPGRKELVGCVSEMRQEHRCRCFFISSFLLHWTATATATTTVAAWRGAVTWLLALDPQLALSSSCLSCSPFDFITSTTKIRVHFELSFFYSFECLLEGHVEQNTILHTLCLRKLNTESHSSFPSSDVSSEKSLLGKVQKMKNRNIHPDLSDI